MPLEAEMVAAAEAGELVDQGAGPFNLAEMQRWGEDRTVRAAVLRHLLVAEQWPVHAKGVRLRGARISGHLDLEAATLGCPLSLECCYLDADDPACFDYATASRVTLTGCQVSGLTGKMLTARELDLSRSTLTGPLVLLYADIAGQLICSGTELTGRDKDGTALDAEGIKVGGSALFDGGFTAAGAVHLPGADIRIQLNCRGARLTGTDSDGNALFGDWMKAGSVFLDGGFTAVGTVRLLEADSGALSCSGARLNGRDQAGNALVADAIKAAEVLLDGLFTAAGAIRLLGADITVQLSCRGAQLTGTDNDGNALFGDWMKAGSVLLDGEFTAAGAIRLASADIAGQLVCSGAQLTGTDSDGNALVADGMKAGWVFLASEVTAAGTVRPFTAAGTVRLFGADITGQLVCSGAQLTGHDNDGNALVAEGIKAAEVLLDGLFTAAGAIRLLGADITVQLSCRGARLTGHDNDGNALFGDWMKAGSVLLDGEFTAAGAIRVASADIAGQLVCSGAQLTGTDSDGNALVGEGIKVGGAALFDGGFTGAGTVGLSSADITGPLNCRGARLNGRDQAGNALVADAIKAAEVLLDGLFTAAGAVRLPGADIRVQLSCRGAQLTGHDNDGDALVAEGIKVGGSVLLDQGFTAAGAVRLLRRISPGSSSVAAAS